MTLEPTPAGTARYPVTPAVTAVHLDPHDPRLQSAAPLAVGQPGAAGTIVVDEAWQLTAPDPEALRAPLARARAGVAFGTVLAGRECSS